jgi:site-specific DNA recombinase
LVWLASQSLPDEPTLSRAFLAPDIVKAAVEGRLPRGYGLKRLVDLPMAWPDQWRMLGLEESTQD